MHTENIEPRIVNVSLGYFLRSLESTGSSIEMLSEIAGTLIESFAEIL